MREILFRGKEKDTPYGALWRYGDLTHHFNSVLINGNVVDPETVGQYTGLKDSQGREIYEGDIIASDYADYRALVAFCNGMFVATWGPDTAYQALYGVLRLKGLCVIGNIHDNPELLIQN